MSQVIAQKVLAEVGAAAIEDDDAERAHAVTIAQAGGNAAFRESNARVQAAKAALRDAIAAAKAGAR
jgi:hypothetical protein